MSVIMMITATKRADRPAASFMLFRMLFLLFLILDIVNGATTGKWAGTEFWVLVLTAEYAATIRTIPPTELSQTDVSGAPIGS
jgi:hypothetical protein